MIRKGKEIVYVGYSSQNLYKTLTRHFQSWLDTSQVRAVYKSDDPAITVRVIKTTAAKADVLETLLILKHQPKDCTVKYKRYIAKSKDREIIEEYESAPETPVWQKKTGEAINWDEPF